MHPTADVYIEEMEIYSEAYQLVAKPDNVADSVDHMLKSKSKRDKDLMSPQSEVVTDLGSRFIMVK